LAINHIKGIKNRTLTNARPSLLVLDPVALKKIKKYYTPPSKRWKARGKTFKYTIMLILLKTWSEIHPFNPESLPDEFIWPGLVSTSVSLEGF